MMNQYQVRESFLNFFKAKKHAHVPSVSVIAKNDPTLMFVNAGMNPFKDIFLGLADPPERKVCNYQKCIRISGKHNDLEEVGLDSTHHTFFEMLGNWSFGSYYKEEAIAWAWELLTKVWQLPPERLFVTVYRTDDEAYQIWQRISQLPPAKIMRFAEKDNFWEMGETGPCGPCSEIHYDKGDLTTQQKTFSDPLAGVNGENERYVEIWNLVFIQYNRLPDQSLQPLPRQYVDTGMGFERIVSILQNKSSNYQTDIFKPLLQSLEKLTKTSYQQKEYQTPMRIIVDHIRMLCICLADGELPSNEGRGYVIRRVLRRAYRYGRLLKQNKPFLYRLAATFIEQMKKIYPELSQKQNQIEKTLFEEEKNFEKTLDKGMSLFNQLIHEEEVKAKKQISGENAFLLYDTYGFPFDLTLLLAKEQGLTVDEKTFAAEMAKQKSLSGSKKKIANPLDAVALKEVISQNTHYVGEEELETQSNLLGIFTLAGTSTLEIFSEQQGILVFAETPFYSESGGQVGDRGMISCLTTKSQFQVSDTQKMGDIVLHYGKVVTGNITCGKEYLLQIDNDLRSAIRKNHSATHLLQQALFEELGTHVRQAGSLVNAEKLRFDFYHYQMVSQLQLQKIESKINQIIYENHATVIRKLPLAAANEMGAKSFFAEKYGQIVRVVQIGESSREFCGGSHVSESGEIGEFKIISDRSIATGIRRIEALSGKLAHEYWQKCYQLATFIASLDVERKFSEMMTAFKISKEFLQKLQHRLKQLQNLKEVLDPLKCLAEFVNLFMGSDYKLIERNETKIFTVDIKRDMQYLITPILNQLQQKIANQFKQQQTVASDLIERLQQIKPQKKGGIFFYEKQVCDLPLEVIRQYIDLQKNTTEKKVIFISNIVREEKILFICGVSKTLSTVIKASELVQIAASICGGNGGGKAGFAQAGGKNIALLDKAIAAINEKIFSEQ